jgi:hypothetical protein
MSQITTAKTEARVQAKVAGLTQHANDTAGQVRQQVTVRWWRR